MFVILSQAGAATVTPGHLDHKLLDSIQIQQDFTKGPTVKVVVNLNSSLTALSTTDLASPSSLKERQTKVKNVQQKVLDTTLGNDVKLRYRFDNIVAFSAEVTAKGLAALQAHPDVVSIESVFLTEAHLAQGTSLMRGMTYRSSYNGAGMAIAICDTGIDYSHARLGGGGFPNSKVIGGYDFGDSDSDPIPRGQAHGTSCAGIAAGDLGTVGDYIGGVAYNAKLYALKISYGTTGSAYSDAMAAAWDWCVTHRNDNPSYPIMVISTSFGGGRYYSTAAGDSYYPSMTTAANNAVAAGITVLASSGNDGFCDSMGWPACISSVISVGAVYDAGFGNYQPCVNAASCAPKIATTGCATGYYCVDVTAADKVTSYSNAATFLTLLAPANKCYTLDIAGSKGYSTGDYTTSFGGTSAACPYAAGAVACLQSAAKAQTGNFLTPQQVRDMLTSNGDAIADTKVAITKPRVNIERAIQALPVPPTSASASPAMICSGASSTLTATGGSGTSCKWYTASCGGTLVGTGVSINITPASPTTYYARWENSSGNSTCAMTTLTVNPLPSVPTSPSANPSIVQSGGSSTLSATPGSGGDTVEWFSGSCGGTPVTSPVSPESTTTYYAKTKNSTAGCLSTICAEVTVTIDNDAPVASFTATEDVDDLKTGGALVATPVTIQGNVVITVTASDSPAGLLDADPVTVTVAGVTSGAVTGSAGVYSCTATINALTVNGAHAITVTATDKAGNVTTSTDWIFVNKNQITGNVLTDFVGAGTRTVTFVMNGGTTMTASVNSGGAYTLTNVPDSTTNISAKTAWTLRKNVTGIEMATDNGQKTAAFTLLGGDLDETNSVNINDYSVLKANWFTSNAVADINGSGIVNGDDYEIMKLNWFKLGD